MAGAIYVYSKTSTGQMDQIYLFESEGWHNLDEGLSDVLQGGARLAVLSGKEREFIIGDMVVYLLPHGEEAYSLVMERKKAASHWKEEFNNIIETVSMLDASSRIEQYEKKFQNFFAWVDKRLNDSKIDSLYPPRDIPSIEERKLVLIGLSKAGKTSIVKRFFKGGTTEDALNTKPTVLRSISRHFVSFLEGNVIIHDLAGQEEFIAHHLFNDSSFRKLLALLFVFDVQDEGRFPQALKYFSLALERIKETSDIGCISVFLHKYDPKLRNQLLSKLTEAIGRILDAASGFPLTFHPTSIFDDSLHHAIIRTLFYALPGDVLEQALTRKRLLLIHQKLQNSEDPEQLAWKEGHKVAEDLLQKWLVWASGSANQVISSETAAQLSVTEGKIQFRLQCPVLDRKKSMQCCHLTSRILVGLCHAIGIDPPVPSPLTEEAQDGFCYFLANK
ncbi:MAG: ADP-ribosylation factor-like protein [Candidatus Hodarchaeales archaeon]